MAGQGSIVNRCKPARDLKVGDRFGLFEIENVEHYTEPGRNWRGAKVEVPMVFVSGISYLFGQPVEDWSSFSAAALVSYEPA